MAKEKSALDESTLASDPSMATYRVLEHLFDAIAIIDSEKRVHFANECLRKLARLKTHAPQISIDAFLELPASCWESLKSESSVPIVHSVPFMFIGGAKGFAQFSIDRLPKDANDGEPRFLCTLRDITFEIQSRTQLDQSEKLIAELRRSHAEAHFLWRLSMETPIYLEPSVVLATIARRLKDELGFADACFLDVPETDTGTPEPILSDLRIGSRLRVVAQTLVPGLRKRQARSEVSSFEHEPFGTFWVTSFRPKVEKPFFLLASSDLSAKESNRRPLMEALATQITSWLDNRSMYLSSITDSLTGLFNRRHFDTRFSVECLLARERKIILSLMLIDIDFFKKINDSFGHQVGDQVLKTLATTLKSTLRTSDIIARVGGEEFAVLLFDTSPEDARVAAEKLRKRVAETPIELKGFNQSIHVTVSCGLSGYRGLPDTTDSVFGAADAALYKAKHAGRNCIVISGGDQAYRGDSSWLAPSR